MVVSDSWFRRGMNIFIPAEYSSLYRVYVRRTEMLNWLFALCTEIPFTVALTSGEVRGKFFKASVETSCKGELAFLQSLKSILLTNLIVTTYINGVFILPVCWHNLSAARC